MTELNGVIIERLIKRIDELEKWIKELCGRQEKTDKKIDVHLKVEEALDEYKKELKKDITGNRDRKFYAIIAIMGVSFTVVQILQRLI